MNYTILDIFDESTMQCIHDQFYNGFITENENMRMQYILGLWRLKSLRNMHHLIGHEKLDQRLFMAEYLDWFGLKEFEYVMDDLELYDWASGVNTLDLWRVGLN